MEKSKASLWKWLILMIVLLCAIVAVPYVRVEILTLLHREEFSDLYEVSGYIENIKYYKVMNYNEERADIFYVAQSVNDGSVPATFLYHFNKQSETWILESWECIWSKHGNAEKIIWPFYLP